MPKFKSDFSDKGYVDGAFIHAAYKDFNRMMLPFQQENNSWYCCRISLQSRPLTRQVYGSYPIGKYYIVAALTTNAKTSLRWNSVVFYFITHYFNE